MWQWRPRAAASLSRCARLSGKARAVGGFTLIEVLVVVVIVSVLAAALVLAIGVTGPERRLEREAEKLQALLTYACEQSELTGREIGFSLATGGYQFSTLERDDWQPIKSDALRARSWPEGMNVSLLGVSGRITIDEKFPERPQLVCFYSGELTPFQLDLGLGEAQRQYRITGDATGAVELQSFASHAR